MYINYEKVAEGRDKRDKDLWVVRPYRPTFTTREEPDRAIFCCYWLDFVIIQNILFIGELGYVEQIQ